MKLLKLNRELIGGLMETVYVYREKEVEIVWRFMDKVKEI